MFLPLPVFDSMRTGSLRWYKPQPRYNQQNRRVPKHKIRKVTIVMDVLGVAIWTKLLMSSTHVSCVQCFMHVVYDRKQTNPHIVVEHSNEEILHAVHVLCMGKIMSIYCFWCVAYPSLAVMSIVLYNKRPIPRTRFWQRKYKHWRCHRVEGGRISSLTPNTFAIDSRSFVWVSTCRGPSLHLAWLSLGCQSPAR